MKWSKIVQETFFFIRLFFLNYNEFDRCALPHTRPDSVHTGTSQPHSRNDSRAPLISPLERSPLPWGRPYTIGSSEDAADGDQDDIVQSAFLPFFTYTLWGTRPKQMIRTNITGGLAKFSRFLPYFGIPRPPTAFHRTDITRSVLHRIPWVFLDNSLYMALDAWPCMTKY